MKYGNRSNIEKEPEYNVKTVRLMELERANECKVAMQGYTSPIYQDDLVDAGNKCAGHLDNFVNTLRKNSEARNELIRYKKELDQKCVLSLQNWNMVIQQQTDAIVIYNMIWDKTKKHLLTYYKNIVSYFWEIALKYELIEMKK